MKHLFTKILLTSSLSFLGGLNVAIGTDAEDPNNPAQAVAPLVPAEADSCGDAAPPDDATALSQTQGAGVDSGADDDDESGNGPQPPVELSVDSSEAPAAVAPASDSVSFFQASLDFFRALIGAKTSSARADVTELNFFRGLSGATPGSAPADVAEGAS